MSLDHKKLKVAVVVLGDLGHSPRITNQALSISELEGAEVELVGYKGSALPQSILEKENIIINYLNPPPSLGPGKPKPLYLLFAPFKALYMYFSLLFILLFNVPSCQYIMLQNPPAIPTLMVVKFVSFVRGSKIIIDWHNFGFTILGLKFGPTHWIVKIAHFYEWYFGCSAYAHITVTEAMAIELKQVWKVRGQVITVHDKAPNTFRPLELSEIHQTLVELENTQPEFLPLFKFFYPDSEPNSSSTLLTEMTQTGKIKYKQDRPMLLISSTSWTPDEDFSILLEALQKYDSYAQSHDQARKLAVIITGKGSEKEHYLNKINELAKTFTHVHIALSWLPLSMYPKLLGSSDMGISLHSSSSGLDLPMKVVDMFGAGLPVLALGFQCLYELVKHNENGLAFNSPEELEFHFRLLFANDNSMSSLKDSIDGDEILKRLRAKARDFGKIRWPEHWQQLVKPLFENSD